MARSNSLLSLAAASVERSTVNPNVSVHLMRSNYCRHLIECVVEVALLCLTTGPLSFLVPQFCKQAQRHTTQFEVPDSLAAAEPTFF